MKHSKVLPPSVQQAGGPLRLFGENMDHLVPELLPHPILQSCFDHEAGRIADRETDKVQRNAGSGFNGRCRPVQVAAAEIGHHADQGHGEKRMALAQP